MKQLNGWWVTDTEEDNGLTYWSPEEWQNHMAEFTVEWFLPKRNKRRVCIDIGANVGQMALGLSKYFDYIHSFEPSPNFFKCLDKNLEDRKIQNVLTYNVGLSDKESTLYFKEKHDRGGTSRFLTQEEVENKEYEREKSLYHFYEVDVKTLDQFNIPNVDLIKIDVEGWEEYVLKGAMNTILKNRPVIVVERHGNITPIDKILAPNKYIMVYKRRSDWYYVPNEHVKRIVRKMFEKHPQASHTAFWKLLGV